MVGKKRPEMAVFFGVAVEWRKTRGGGGCVGGCKFSDYDKKMDS